MESTRKTFVDYFRCPSQFAAIEAPADLSTEEGYFAFEGAICYGRRSGGQPSRYINEGLTDVAAAAACEAAGVRLPFDLSEVVTNLREERYRQRPNTYLERITAASGSRSLYYLLRPLMPVGVRKHLQKIRLNGWERIRFPRWPMDVTVETLMEQVMALLLKQGGPHRVPFIWFWPHGAKSCAIMTHDVEGQAGTAFCDALMDLDDSFDIKSAFQLVPDAHRATLSGLAEKLRRRGFEVNLHDLSHDGHLFENKKQFLQRAAQINQYARQFKCRGFRSGAMYREQRWYDALEFAYDMSVPNAAHLEPQRGGCCTVMPYFVGDILELPLTTTQDYSLFHILGEYSTALWKEQTELLLSKNGLISFITHPDYLSEPRAFAVYTGLLEHLAHLRAERGLWMALPGEVDRWWRSRSRMTLVPDGGSWRIEGPGSRRARLAYASLEDDRIVYTLDDAS